MSFDQERPISAVVQEVSSIAASALVSYLIGSKLHLRFEVRALEIRTLPCDEKCCRPYSKSQIQKHIARLLITRFAGFCLNLPISSKFISTHVAHLLSSLADFGGGALSWIRKEVYIAPEPEVVV
jgi:hypothetical protein